MEQRPGEPEQMAGFSLEFEASLAVGKYARFIIYRIQIGQYLVTQVIRGSATVIYHEGAGFK